MTEIKKKIYRLYNTQRIDMNRTRRLISITINKVTKNITDSDHDYDIDKLVAMLSKLVSLQVKIIPLEHNVYNMCNEIAAQLNDDLISQDDESIIDQYVSRRMVEMCSK